MEIQDEREPLLQTSFPDPDDLDEENPSSPGGLGLDYSQLFRVLDYSQLFKSFKVRLRYYVPVVGWIPKYKLEMLQHDIVAGLTVAFLIIPQSLSYAQALVNVPPIIGLYSAFITQFVYALLGTSRQLAVGPEALVSILVGSCIKDYTLWRDANPANTFMSFNSVIPPATSLPIPNDPYYNIQPTALLCLLVGLFTFILGFFRLGFLDSVLSRALLRGFVLAVACVVMIDMTPILLGLYPPTGQCLDRNPPPAFPVPTEPTEPESPFQKLLSILLHLPNSHFLTSALSFCSISFLLFFRTIKKQHPQNRTLQLVPEILVLVVVSVVITQFLRWDCSGVAILNTTDASLPPDVSVTPSPTIAKVKHLFLSAILISVIGFVESIVVAKTYASKHRYGVSPNRELVAMGVGNIASSLFGGFPAYGSLGRSADYCDVVNDAAGAQTQLSGFITGCVVFTTAMWLLPLFKFLPKSVSSSIIVVAALRLIELEEISFLIQIRAWKDLGLLLLTFFSTVFLSIETGTLISVVVSLLLVVKHTTTTRIVLLGETLMYDTLTGKQRKKYRSLKDQGDSDRPISKIDGVLLIRFEEGMFFGNVGQLKERLKRIEIHGDLGIHPGEDPMVASTSTPMNEHHREHDDNGWDVERSDSPVYEQGVPSFSPKLHGVVFDMKAVSELDASAVQTLYEICHEYLDRQVLVCFVKLRNECRDLFERSGLVELVGRQHFHGKIQDAVADISSNRIAGHNHPVLVIDSSSSSAGPSSRSPLSALPFRQQLPKPTSPSAGDFASSLAFTPS